jgi:hypothetical protein
MAAVVADGSMEPDATIDRSEWSVSGIQQTSAGASEMTIFPKRMSPGIRLTALWNSRRQSLRLDVGEFDYLMLANLITLVHFWISSPTNLLIRRILFGQTAETTGVGVCEDRHPMALRPCDLAELTKRHFGAPLFHWFAIFGCDRW